MSSQLEEMLRILLRRLEVLTSSPLLPPSPFFLRVPGSRVSGTDRRAAAVRVQPGGGAASNRRGEGVHHPVHPFRDRCLRGQSSRFRPLAEGVRELASTLPAANQRRVCASPEHSAEDGAVGDGEMAE